MRNKRAIAPTESVTMRNKMAIAPDWVGDHEKQNGYSPQLSPMTIRNTKTMAPDSAGDHEKQKAYRPRLGRGPPETKRL